MSDCLELGRVIVMGRIEVSDHGQAGYLCSGIGADLEVRGSLTLDPSTADTFATAAHA